MATTTPACANEFIEDELQRRLAKVEEGFGAQALGFTGPLVFGVDDLMRSVVEGLVRREGYKRRLVIVLTTAGGYIEVVQRIVETIRHHYDHVTFVVPNYAYSAGTVFAMSGNDIYMDYYSRLGPIDPQIQKESGAAVPALGYLAKWEALLQKAKDGTLTMVEAQLMIQGFDQGELYLYEQARELSVAMLKDWLVKYKFAEWHETEHARRKVTSKLRTSRAEAIARILNDTERWHSHGHGISREVLERDVQLRIEDLDADSNALHASAVKAYYSLADDFITKMGKQGMIHTTGALMFL